MVRSNLDESSVNPLPGEISRAGCYLRSYEMFSSAGLASTCQGGVGGSVSVGGREMDVFKSLPDLLSMY